MSPKLDVQDSSTPYYTLIITGRIEMNYDTLHLPTPRLTMGDGREHDSRFNSADPLNLSKKERKASYDFAHDS
jgi:hypothetical protein